MDFCLQNDLKIINLTRNDKNSSMTISVYGYREYLNKTERNRILCILVNASNDFITAVVVTKGFHI